MKFLVTRELGRLVKWLRLLGFDTAYESQGQPFLSILIRAHREERILVTRNRLYAGHQGVKTVWVQHDEVEDQLTQLTKELGLKAEEESLFTRCLKCNTELEEIDKPKVKERVPPFVFDTVTDFVRCPQCDQIFWPGTHVALVEEFLEKLKLGTHGA